MKKFFLLASALLICMNLSAQLPLPAPSPTFELKGTVGLSEVKVVYSRPSAKDRKVFGKLVPFGEVWRTGANASTKISFSQDVVIEGNPVPAGEYALYSIPGEKEFTIILSKNLTWWGTLGYDEAEDFLRFNVPTKHPSSHYETFTVSFSDFTMNSAKLNMKWEKTKAVFKIEQDAEAIALAYIQEHMIDSNTAKDSDYYRAAGFFYDKYFDNKKALEWANKAIEISGDQKKYWEYHLKAKILARLNQNQEAMKFAKESIELAKAGKNPDYVRLNERLLATLDL